MFHVNDIVIEIGYPTIYTIKRIDRQWCDVVNNDGDFGTIKFDKLIKSPFKINQKVYFVKNNKLHSDSIQSIMYDHGWRYNTHNFSNALSCNFIGTLLSPNDFVVIEKNIPEEIWNQLSLLKKGSVVLEKMYQIQHIWMEGESAGCCTLKGKDGIFPMNLFNKCPFENIALSNVHENSAWMYKLKRMPINYNTITKEWHYFLNNKWNMAEDHIDINLLMSIKNALGRIHV